MTQADAIESHSRQCLQAFERIRKGIKYPSGSCGAEKTGVRAWIYAYPFRGGLEGLDPFPY